MFALYCYKQWLSSVIMYQKRTNTFIAVVHLTINFFSNYQHLVVVFTAALSRTIAIHSLLLTHFTNNYYIHGWAFIKKMQVHISHPYFLLTRRVKWGEHGMGPVQHRLKTATPFKSQKILFKARALGSNIRPALPSYMIYFISLLSSHPSWAPPPPPSTLREVLRYTYF